MPVVVLGVIPEEFFLGTDTVNGFNQATGKQVGKGPYDLVNFFVQQFKIGIGLMLLDKGAGFFGLGAGFVLTVDHFAIVHILVGNDHGVSHPFAIHLQNRNHFTDKGFGFHFVGGPHLAGDAVPHGVFNSQIPWQEVRGTTVRSRAVFGSRLSENGEIRRNGEVAGHADFLAPGDAHAVNPADDRFFAGQNSIHHMIEQFHVLTVFITAQAVKFAVFLGISAGTKGVGTRAGEYDRNDAAI